jgi:hypothetical protein
MDSRTRMQAHSLVAMVSWLESMCTWMLHGDSIEALYPVSLPYNPCLVTLCQAEGVMHCCFFMRRVLEIAGKLGVRLSCAGGRITCNGVSLVCNKDHAHVGQPENSIGSPSANNRKQIFAIRVRLPLCDCLAGNQCR